MTRKEAKQVAKMMEKANFYGITILESFPSGEIRVSGFNPCGGQRVYVSVLDAKGDINRI